MSAGVEAPSMTGGGVLEEGADMVEITEQVLEVSKATAAAGDDGAGAISLFVGTTRDNFEGKRVVRLEYEAYTPMALKEMMKICGDVRKQWAVTKIVILHRIGLCPIQEASVIIAVSSPHRKEAMEAVTYAIDTLKLKVPIWKKEVYGEGEGDAIWKANKLP